MKCLVVGYGSIGSRYVKIIKRLNVDYLIFDKFKKGKHIINDFDKVEFKNITHTIICTPTNKHIEIAKKILKKKNCKKILIEKPLSHKLDGILELKRLIKKNRAMVFVVSNLRYHTGFINLKKNIKKIGKVKFARAFFGNHYKFYKKNYKKNYFQKVSNGGGIIFDSCHEIDLLMQLFGTMNVKKSFHFSSSKPDFNSPDYLNVIFKHKNILSEINLNLFQYFKERGLEIFGNTGTIKWTSSGKKKERVTLKFFSNPNKKVKILLKKEYDINEMYRKQIKLFFNDKFNFLQSLDSSIKIIKILRNIIKC